MAGFVKEGGKGAAIITGILQAEVEALAGAHALEPREEFGMAGGIGGEDADLGAGLEIGQVAGVEVSLGDIDADGSGAAGEAGFGGDEGPGGGNGFGLGAAWHGGGLG